VLTSDASGNATWQAVSSGGITTVGALDAGTINANVLSISGSTIYIQSASATEPGIVNTASQSFAGTKTFSNVISSGNVQAATLKITTSPTSGYVLTSDASGNATWQVAPTSGVNTVGALDGGTTNANVLSISGSNIYIQSASGTNPGVVNTASQTFAGTKTFSNIISSGNIQMATFKLTTAPTAGYVLTSDASGNGTWAATGASGVTTIGALDGGTANANSATITGVNLYLQSASVTYAGLVNITTQSFAGAKTFTTSIATPAFRLSTTPTNGYYLTCDASGNGAWTAPPSSGITTVGALDGGTTNANVLSISGSNIYIQSASATQPGVVNTATQTMVGAKTFSTSVSTPALKLSTGPSANYIMTSDASGNASWAAPTTYSNGTVLSAGNVTGVANPAGGLSVGASGFAANTDGTTTQILSNNIHAVTSITEYPVLTPTDITNGYKDVSFPIVGASSAQLGCKGLIQQIQGLDFSVAVTGGIGGVGRYTFLTALLPGGNQALVSGDQLILTYNRF
jgi:hypothetical protein